MEINKFGLLLFGLFFIYLGVDSLIIGETSGFAASFMSAHTVTFGTHPIEFSLNITFNIIVGGLCMRKGLSKKELEK
jgi:hypothetical protein